MFPPPFSLFYPSTEYSRDYPRSPQIHVSAGVVPRHWKGMENGDPPLMTSWAPEAMELFREELCELEKLSAAQQAVDNSAMETARALATATVTQQMAATQRQSPGQPRGNHQKSRQSQNEARAALAAERDRRIEEMVQETLNDRQRQLWRQVLRGFEEIEEEAERTIGPIRAHEQQEYDFFLSRPLNGYCMNDILSTSSRRRTIPSGTAAVTSAGGGTGRMNPRGFVIDAAQFAQDYNETLTAEYGFKPILGPSPLPSTPRRTIAEREKEDATQQQLLSLHRPGLQTTPPEFFLSTVPRVVFGNKLPELPRAVRAAERPSPLPAAPTANHGNSPLSTITQPPTLPGAGSSLSGIAKSLGIDCSAKNCTINLSTYTGEIASEILCFTNRNAHRTRLRLRASEHPWLTFRCRRVCPVPGRKGGKDLTHESLLACGGFLEVEARFHPTDMTNPSIRECLRVGVTRERNSRAGDGALWDYVEVRVEATVIPPTLMLSEVADTEEVTPAALRKQLQPHDGPALTCCTFPPTLVLARTTQRYCVTNVGSDAVLNILTASPAFEVSPTPETDIPLPRGESVTIAITFIPPDEGAWSSTMTVVVREDDESMVLAEHTFDLIGTAVIPRFAITRINETMFSVDSPAAAVEGDGETADAVAAPSLPRYIAEDVAPEVPAHVTVIVRNYSAMPFPFRWCHDVVGGEPPPMVTVHPSFGVFPADGEVTFTATVTSHDAAALISCFNLFLDGLPVTTGSTPEDHSALHHVSGPVMQLLRQDKMLPSASAAVEGLRARQEPAETVLTDAYADPYAAFLPYFTQQDARAVPGTFITGFFLFANPVAPSLAVVPPLLAEVVECLVGYDNMRRVTLHNPSPCPLCFYWNPNTRESRGRCEQRSAEEEAHVRIQCHPRTGRIPPHGSVVVIVTFAVLRPGRHIATIACFVPEVADRVPAGHPFTPATLTVSVTGVGPSVHTSTELLDFGLIELGGEALASLTVTNDNPVPIVFDLQDPMLRDPPRFVFIPATFRLTPGDAVEVTVYRKAVTLDDAQTFFELIVRDGATTAIETRATIQMPTMILDDATINFGRVPAKLWHERALYITNTSALDIPFTVELASPACPYIELEMERSHVLRAGQSHVPVMIRGRFNPYPRGTPSSYIALLGIRALRSGHVLLAEVRCESVEQLSVSVDLLTTVKPYVPLRLLDRRAPPAGMPVFSPPAEVPIASYLRAMLLNLVMSEVLWPALEAPTTGSLSGTAKSTLPLTATFDKVECVAESLSVPIQVRTTLPDDSPVCMEHLQLLIKNHSPCSSACAAEACHYIMIPSTVIEGTLGGTMGKAFCGANSSGFTSTLGMTPPLVDMAPGVALAQWVHTFRPIFWTTAKEGKEQRERTRRAALAGAQQLLLDGRGCASTVPCDLQDLDPFAEVQLPVMLLANLPGRFEERLRVSCDGLPKVDLPVTWEVHGRPVLLDPTTSGLTTTSKHETLFLPPVIASLGTSRRTLRLLNRSPRDLNVRVDLFLCASTFSVVAVDTDPGADQVVLRLAPISEKSMQRDRDAYGAAWVTPSSFFMAAMASKEVVLEYTPVINVVKDVLDRLDRNLTVVGKDEDDEDDCYKGTSAQEVDWNGSLVVYAELATSAFNDTFLIDEFYQTYREKYPSKRCIQRSEGSEGSPWTRSIVRSVPMLQVLQPLRTRPGRVLRNSRLLMPTEAERFLLDRELSRRERHSATRSTPQPDDLTPHILECAALPSPWLIESCAPSIFPAEVQPVEDSSDDSDGENDDNIPLLEAESGSLRPLQVLLDEEQERHHIQQYLERRREELRLASHEYFMPIELCLRARCGIPRVAVQPSASGVLFPMYHDGERCIRTVRLTNYNSACLHFMVHTTDPQFTILSTVLVTSHVEGDPLMEDDEEGRRAKRDARVSKWCSLTEQNKMHGMLQDRDSAKHQNAITGYCCADGSNFVPLTASAASYRGCVPVYRLNGSDAMDVTMEYRPEGATAAQNSASSMSGCLKLQFLQQSAVCPASNLRNSARPRCTTRRNSTTDDLGGAHGTAKSPCAFSFGFLPTLAATVEQIVPLRVPLSIPMVSCSPDLLWFRPGKTLHDGREQSAYAQRLTLFNSAEEQVRYNIVPIEVSRVGLVTKEGSTTVGPAAALTMTASAKLTTAAQLTRERKIEDVVCMPEQWVPAEGSENLLLVNGPDSEIHFEVSPRSGIIPAASPGGEPGRTFVLVSFKEYSAVRYEWAFMVHVNGEASEAVFMIRGDSRDTEV